MALDTETASELTQEEVKTILTAPLEQKSVFLAAGPVMFDGDGSPIRIPSLPGPVDEAEVKWYGQNELIGEVDPEFGETQLLPSTMKSVKVITRYSNELARQSVVSLDSALQSRLVADVAAKFDAQFLGATGDGITTPKGMFAWDGVQEVGTVGEVSLDALLDGYGMALGAQVDPSKLSLFLRPEDYMNLRKLKDNDGRYLLQPDASTGGIIVPALGATAYLSNRIPEGSAALADMSQVAVARDMAPSVKILTERYADYDPQAIRVVARYDAAPLNPEAVVTFTGITQPGA